jgi:hypothetical protein
MGDVLNYLFSTGNEINEEGRENTGHLKNC